MADYTAKLTPATAKAAPSQIQWEEDKRDAFYHLRSVLVNVCVLNVPAPGDEFVLQTDASLLGVGSVLNIVRIQEELPGGLLCQTAEEGGGKLFCYRTGGTCCGRIS